MSTSGAGRPLGLVMCTALVVGNMIGSGIFLLPASLARYGSLGLVGWLITSTGAVLVALVFARLSRLVPRAGGPYAYTRRGLGDFAGFLVAWGYWISILATNAAISVAFVSYATIFWPALAERRLTAALLALATIWGLTFVNASGVRNGGWVQLVTAILKVLPLFGIVVAGALYFEPAHIQPPPPGEEGWLGQVNATVALTLWAFLGLESATVPADHVADPGKTIARATIAGTLLAAAVYVFSTLAVMGILPPERLAVSTAPFAEAGEAVLGPAAGTIMGLGAMVSCFGALNGWILLQGQVPLASARDGLFPAVFARVSSSGVPVAGILLSSVLVTLLMAFNYTRALVDLFTFVILLATLTCLLPYVFSATAGLMIARQDPERFPGRRLASWAVLCLLAFLYSFYAIAGAGAQTVYWGFLLLVAGLPVYVWIQWRPAGRGGEHE